MPASRRAASRLRPGWLGAALLVATLLLAGALAWQATRAARSHRATALGMLRDYAAIAAWEYTREGRIWLSFGMNEAGAAIERQLAYGGATLPGPELLRTVLAEKDCDCMSAGFARTAFRIAVAPEPSLLADGEPLSPTSRDSLLLLAAETTSPGDGPRTWRILPPGSPALARPDDVVLLWHIAGRSDGTATAVRAMYGMVVEPAQIHRPLRGALDEATLLPPSLTGTARAEALVHLTVGAPGRQPVLTSEGSPVAPETPRAIDTLGWRYGNLAVTAAVRPEAAQLLIVGGLPASRLPQIVALLALTVAMGGGALILIRREQQLARLRDDFVSSVSHELRTPLTQIRVLSELLESDGFRSAAERERALRVVHRESLRLSNLVDNLLTFGRLRRRVVRSAPAPAVPLARVIDDVALAFQAMLASRATRLVVECPSDLTVRADAEDVATVVRNLVENAAKYGPHGQTVTLSAAPFDHTARITVDDEGPGVPAADRARIWQPYERLERDRNGVSGGSGLGLAVVAQLAAVHGGRAWVEPRDGPGARFVVELPR